MSSYSCKNTPVVTGKVFEGFDLELHIYMEIFLES